MNLDAEATSHLSKVAQIEPTDDSAKFATEDTDATVKAIWNGTKFVDAVEASEATVGLIFNRTNFYSEQGGQVYDVGTVSSNDAQFEVQNVQVFAGYCLHIGKIKSGAFKLGQAVTLSINKTRRLPIMSNHTFTHVINFALRKVLGMSVDQKGSLVDDEKLRFDFSHNKALSLDEIKEVERICNEIISKNLNVYSQIIELSKAKSINALRAVFGETYPDPVKVVSIGVPISDLLAKPDNPEWMNYSIELCGGTHLKNTSEAKHLVVLSETGIAKGVRRIIAVTGDAVKGVHDNAVAFEKKINEASSKKGDDLAKIISGLSAEFEALSLPASSKPDLQKKIDGLVASKVADKKNAEKVALQRAEELANKANENKELFVVEEIDVDADRKALNSAVQVIKDKCPTIAICLMSRSAKQVAIITAVGKDLSVKLNAGNWARDIAEVCGGKGGGKAEAGQGSGDNASKFDEAKEKAISIAKSQL
jgi:alanyl-tRNA synthetase